MANQTPMVTNLLSDNKEEQVVNYIVVGEEQRTCAIGELRMELNLRQTIEYQEACLEKLCARIGGGTETEMEFLPRFNGHARCTGMLRTGPADVNLA